MVAPKIRHNGWYGCRRDTRDARDIVFRPRAIRLPDRVDLRPNMPPVMDQGNIGSCTAHGITAALRYLRLSAGKPDVPFSRLQLYYDERVIEGTVGEDAGAEIRDGIKCAAKIGVARETMWSYDPSRFRDKPTPPVYGDARAYKSLAYERVPVSVSALKQALARKLPVIIGVSVYESFESKAVEKSGVVPMPNLKREGLVGAHCMLVVGYGQRPGCFTVRNSWGADWGDHGDCYLHEAYIGSDKYGADYWLTSSAS